MIKNSNLQEPEDFAHGDGIKAAVDIAIFNDLGQILLGKRLSKAGCGTWGFPGGHLFANESLHTGAERELREELGEQINVVITNKIIGVRENNIAPYFIHHITTILEGKYIEGDLFTNEKDKCAMWKWYDLNDLPTPLFSGIDDLLKNYTKNITTIVSDWHYDTK